MNNNDVWEISKWFKRFSNRHEVIIKNWEERKEEIKETLVREKGERYTSLACVTGEAIAYISFMESSYPQFCERLADQLVFLAGEAGLNLKDPATFSDVLVLGKFLSTGITEYVEAGANSSARPASPRLSGHFVEVDGHPS